MPGKHSDYPSFRKSGRLKGEPRQELLDYVYPGPPERDQFILNGVHQFDLAHTVMLQEHGILNSGEARKILLAFQEMEQEGVLEVRTRIRGGIHSGESFLTKKVGKDIAGKIPTGRSTGDLNSVSRRIAIRDGLVEVMEGLLRLREVLLSRAEENLDTIMPEYSHGKRMQPSTFAHYCLFWVCPLERDFQRLLGAFSRTNSSTAEEVTLFTSKYALSRERVAELLGFDDIIKHNGDATWNYDFWLESVSALAILWTNLSRLAESLNLFCGDEYGLLELDDGLCWTSSVMPHKKNPYPLQYLKGQGGVAIGQMLSAFTVERGNPRGIIMDRNVVMQDAGNLFKQTGWGLSLAREILKTLEVNRELMRQRVGEFWEHATDLALAISQDKGLPMRTTHHIVAKLVRMSKEIGKGPRDVTPEMLDQAAQEELGYPLGVDSEFIDRAFDSLESIKARTIAGGESPQAVAREIRAHEKTLQSDTKDLGAIKDRIEESQKKLRQAIKKILESA